MKQSAYWSIDDIGRSGAILLALTLFAIGCAGGSSTSTTGTTANAQEPPPAEAPTATTVPEPTETPEPTATPAPSATPEPAPTPDPDIDDDGVPNEKDDFPDDPNRSVALVSQFPVIDGINQLPEDLPSVQALRVIQAAVLTDEADATDTDALAERFAPSFLASVPLADIESLIDSVRQSAAGRWDVVDVRAITQYWLWVQMGDPNNLAKATHLLRIGVDPNTELITEAAINDWRYGLQTQQYAADQTKQLDNIVADLASKADFVGVLVADVDQDGCTTIAGHNQDVPLGTASIFKEWVLGAAATEIEAGRLDPEQIVVFAPGDYFAVGSMTTAQFQSTFELTLQEAANLMINQSDNGATDMVERTVGREATWDFVDASGVADPTILNPLIRIADYGHLFSSVSAAQVDSFVKGTEEEQERFLLEVLDPLGPNTTSQSFNPAVREYTWTASPMDICETIATIRNRFAPDSEAGMFIDEAFSGEVALFGIRNEWDRTWYKGGGIPGSVFTHSTFVESNDGDAHVVVAMFNSDGNLEEEQLPFEVASLQSRIFELLADQ